MFSLDSNPSSREWYRPEQLEMGILDFLANLDEEGKRYQEEAVRGSVAYLSRVPELNIR